MQNHLIGSNAKSHNNNFNYYMLKICLNYIIYNVVFNTLINLISYFM